MPTEGLIDRPTVAALQGQRSDVTELILFADFVCRTIGNWYKRKNGHKNCRGWVVRPAPQGDL